MANLPKQGGNIKYDNPLGISWQDNGFIPHLNPSNVVTYFAGSPFYDKQCNNEILAMQGRAVTPENLAKLAGVEYILLHCQEPILYVIRKQHRHSPTSNHVSPLANYYIVAGVVFQAPDLFSVINSRLLSCTIHLQKALDETLAASKYTPDKGYHWNFGDGENTPSGGDGGSGTGTEEDGAGGAAAANSSTSFQRQFVDAHLAEMTRRHFQRPSGAGGAGGRPGGAATANTAAPPTVVTAQATGPPQPSAAVAQANTIIKSEPPDDVGPSYNRGSAPPDKKPRLTTYHTIT